MGATPVDWFKASLVAAASVALVLMALRVFGRWRWNRLTRALVARLEAGRQAMRPARFDTGELAGLPPVVQRYFRAVLPEGAPLITGAVVGHTGMFNMSEGGTSWKLFTSRQHVVTRRLGFVWNGHIRALPGLGVYVHDAYIAGEGILRPAILGIFSLMDLRGGGDIAQGELLRFFAETPWYPTALLPSQGVVWEAVDADSARATLCDCGLTAVLRFEFDAQGLIASVRAEARGRTVGGKIVMQPWEGRWSDYQTQAGMRVPMAGEVAWLPPDGQGARKPYWRGRITDLSYTFAP